MKVDEMHHTFRLELDRVDTSSRPDFESHEIDAYLNKAIMKFLKDRYGFDEKNKKGFETDQSRISQLSSLHVKSPQLQPLVAPIDLGDGRYELRLNDLGKNINGQYFRYMFLTDGFITASKGNCTKYIPIDQKRVDTLSTEYNDASWVWRRVIVNFGRSTFVHPHIKPDTEDDADTTADLEPDFQNRFNSDELSSLYLSTNNKYGESQFTIDQVALSYIKYPNRVFSGGYNHIDGMSKAQDKQIHCDIGEAFHEEIVSIAVRLAEEDIQDVKGVQLHQPKLQEYKSY